VPTIRNGSTHHGQESHRRHKHEIKGAVKEVAGKVTGNPAREAAGNVEKNAGKVQKEVGKAADKSRKH